MQHHDLVFPVLIDSFNEFAGPPPFRDFGHAGALTAVPAAYLTLVPILVDQLHKKYGWFGATPVEPKTIAGLPGPGNSGGAARAETNPLFQSTAQPAEKAREINQHVTDAAKSSEPIQQRMQSAADAATKIQNAIQAAASAASPAANSAAAANATTRPVIPLAPVPHQKGGIAIRPHIGLVGEAGAEAIIPLKQGGRLLGGITVNAPITINGPVADQGNLAAILAEYAREIARQVKRALEIEYEQQAVV